MRGTLVPLILLVAALLPSCASVSYPYRFEPSPAEVQVVAGEGGPLVARVLVSVVGAEREDGRRGGFPLLVTRLRIEARGPGRLVLDPASVQVVGPDLAEFGPARYELEGPLEVPPGESRDLTLRFPFPRAGNLRMPRLTGVNMHLTLDTPAGPRDISVTLKRNEFERFDRNYYRDYPPRWNYGFGFSYYGC